MRKDIIQSKTEPNKNDIWLSEEGLKKYGKDGWEPLGGGIFPSTPIVNEVSGNELVPINVDGENKAVSAAALVKEAKEVYVLDVDNYKTKEDYNNLKAAVDSNKLIISQGVIFSLAELPNGNLMGATHAIVGAPGDNSPQLQIDGVIVEFSTDGQVIRTDNEFVFDGTGDGTKFLSDDGTYKEISGGSESYVIDSNTTANDLYSYLSESTTEINEYFNPNIIIEGLDGGGLNYSGKCIEIIKNEGVVYLICTGEGFNPGGWGVGPFVLICTSESITVENYVLFINNSEHNLTPAQRGTLNSLPYSKIPYILGIHTIKEELDYLNYYKGSPYSPFNNVFIEINDGMTTYYGYAHSIYYSDNGYIIQCIGTISIGTSGGRLSNQMFTFLLTEENGYELIDETDESIPKRIENLENAVYNGPVVINIELEGDGTTLTDAENEAIQNQNVKIKYNVTSGDTTATIIGTPILYAKVGTDTIVMLTKYIADNGTYKDLQCTVDTNIKTLIANVIE